MKVLLDEDVPKKLARFLGCHEIHTVITMGWRSIKNGRLLRLIEQEGFAVFITADQAMKDQQRLEGRPFAVLLLSATNWPIIQPHVERILQAVDCCETGKLLEVECGRFKPGNSFKVPG